MMMAGAYATARAAQEPRPGAAQPAGEPSRPGAQAQRTAKPDEVALIGCVEFETDYRKRQDAGRGGVLGSGVGQSNEFVLTMARRAPAASTPESRAGGNAGDSARASAGSGRDASSAAPVGTAGSAAVYMLTGDAESELKRAVGKQVEIVGTIENADSSKPGATDVSNLPRVNIALWHPVADFCPAEGTQQPQSSPNQKGSPDQQK
jgi:hypothetical protein